VQSEPKPVPRYRFGPIEVDPVAGEIYKSGIKVRLPRKPFQILLALLERPGEVVTVRRFAPSCGLTTHLSSSNTL
jgi:DNA-binding winged helix-turn-helix (wHTH) protein